MLQHIKTLGGGEYLSAGNEFCDINGVEIGQKGCLASSEELLLKTAPGIKTLKEIEAITNVGYSTLTKRLNKGVSLEEIIANYRKQVNSLDTQKIEEYLQYFVNGDKIFEIIQDEVF